MATGPVYQRGDQVYLRESAGIGFLEGYAISTVTNTNGQWMYSLRPSGRRDQAPIFGERIGSRPQFARYFTSDEFVDELTALQLMKAYLADRLASVTAEIKAKYPTAT